MRVMVTGSRNWTDVDRVHLVLGNVLVLGGLDTLIHGAAPGLDTIAGEWATANGIKVLAVPAAWDHYGKRAGPIRNGWMLDERPDLVIAFPLPDSRGTWNAVRQAEARGIPVNVIKDLIP